MVALTEANQCLIMAHTKNQQKVCNMMKQISWNSSCRLVDEASVFWSGKSTELTHWKPSLSCNVAPM
jgi:hypothetical protein